VKLRLDFRFGSKADIGLPPVDVRFTAKSGHWFHVSERPLRAISGHYATQQNSVFAVGTRVTSRPRTDHGVGLHAARNDDRNSVRRVVA
jgi:hypothetical protein